jgi:hypothetical protein
MFGTTDYCKCIDHTFAYLSPSDLLTMGTVCKKWSELTNAISAWSPYLSSEFEAMSSIAMAECNPKQMWLRLKMKSRFLYTMDKMNFIRVDLATGTSQIERTLSYHADFLLLKNGKVLFCGGWKEDRERCRIRTDIWLYDPKNKSVETIRERGENRTGIAMVELENYVYMFGGSRKGYHARNACRYILKTREKQFLPYLPFEMKTIVATAHVGNIYLCHTPRLEIERFDPRSSSYKHVIRASNQTYSSILLSVPYENHWALVVAHNSPIVNLDMQTMSPLKIRAKAVPKKCVSRISQYRDGLYFLGQTEGVLSIWRVKVALPSTMSIVQVGLVTPA